MENEFDRNRNYSSISPSARSLLLMKGYTNIPYASQLARLMQGPEAFGLNFEDKDFWFWIRVMHFENRYWSIDQLLKETDHKNILELSSGFSLRGLDMCAKEAVHYIDTDLPDVIATKQQLIDELGLTTNLAGQFELAPLNAMQADDFNAILNRFGKGAITIVNEGLLMYLNIEEKKQLCRTIHDALKERGGCWITADVYVKRPDDMRARIPQSQKEAAFFAEHNIEKNKFESYEFAQAFFEAQGLSLVKEAIPNYAALSVMPHLLKVMPEEFRNRQEPPPKIQATWKLVVKG